MMKLYVAERSGNSHKVQLFLSILGLAYETIELTYDETSLKSSMFLTRNPRGQVPFLDVEGQGIWDSQAILVYLARAHGGERWLPLDPFGMAEVMQWLALSENELLFGLAQLRIMRRYRKGNEPLVLTQMERAIGYAQRGLRVMEGRLAQ
ncbi:MAG: glutathione S-transferase family protein, partial [Alphaproteobacteria bacterium]